MKRLWEKLSGRSRWFYIPFWIVLTALSWASYKLIIEPIHTNLNNLNIWGYLFEIALAALLVGTVQGTILKLYLKTFSIPLWIFACSFWFSQTIRSFPIPPRPVKDLLNAIGIELNYLTHDLILLVLFPIVSWLVLKKYSQKAYSWLFSSILILFYVLIASNSQGASFASEFITFDLIQIFFDVSYQNYFLRYPSIGFNIGVLTSLIFLVSPKESLNLSEPPSATFSS